MPSRGQADRINSYVRRSVSRQRRSFMSVRVYVRPGEDVREAVRRLGHRMRHHCRRAWYKTRFGYYEKPSIRRRRKDRLAARCRRIGSLPVVPARLPRKLFFNRLLAGAPSGWWDNRTRLRPAQERRPRVGPRPDSRHRV